MHILYMASAYEQGFSFISGLLHALSSRILAGMGLKAGLDAVEKRIIRESSQILGSSWP
jgi:hypothetical protein